MIKDTNIQIPIIITKELNEKIIKEAKENFASRNWVIRKIITDYYKEQFVRQCCEQANKAIQLVVKDFVEKLKQEFFFMKTTASKDNIYQFTDSQINEFIKRFLHE